MNRLFTLDLADNRVKVGYEYCLGHKFGQGQISPDSRFNFIHIPKNASSEIKRVLGDWQLSNFYDIESDIEHLVILRDPTDRWISGLAEFLVGANSHMGGVNTDITVEEVESLMETRMFQNLLFDFVIFDGHTLPQCRYLEGINLDDVTFFYHDEMVIPRLMEYVGLPLTTKNTNDALRNPKKSVIIKKLKSLLDSDPKLQHIIDTHYYADHQLFDKVTFQY